MPWKKISGKIIHKNPWFSLREDDVLRPDGSEGKYFYIDNIDSVMTVAQDKDGKLFLIEQGRHPVENNSSWEFPGGKSEEGQSPLKEAQKELEQEIGFRANKWQEGGFVNPEIGASSAKCFIFFASELTKTKTDFENTEDIKIARKTVADIQKMIEKNEITCARTICAFYKYLMHQKVGEGN